MKEIIEQLKQIPFIARFFDETNAYWIKARNIFFSIAVLAGVIILLPSNGVEVPQVVLNWCGYIATFATAVGLTAQHTKK